MSDEAKREKRGPQIKGYTFRPWKIVLIVIALASIAGGALLALKGGNEKRAPTASSPAGQDRLEGAPNAVAGTDGMKSGFRVERDENGNIGINFEPDPGDTGVWSPALLRGGLSFFVAFCLAFAFRSFMRIAVMFLGVWLASLFFLNHLGWIEIHWNLIEAPFDDFTSRIGDQMKSAQAFLTGSLPSAGAAGAGLFTGFRKG